MPIKRNKIPKVFYFNGEKCETVLNFNDRGYDMIVYRVIIGKGRRRHEVNYEKIIRKLGDTKPDELYEIVQERKRKY